MWGAASRVQGAGDLVLVREESCHIRKRSEGALPGLRLPLKASEQRIDITQAGMCSPSRGAPPREIPFPPPRLKFQAGGPRLQGPVQSGFVYSASFQSLQMVSFSPTDF